MSSKTPVIYPSAEIASLKSKVSLLGLIEGIFPLAKLRRNQGGGNSYTSCCPVHEDKNPSFGIDDDKGLCHCMSCGAGGDHISFLMNHTDISFKESLKKLCEAAGMSFDDWTASLAKEQGSSPSLEMNFSKNHSKNVIASHIYCSSTDTGNLARAIDPKDLGIEDRIKEFAGGINISSGSELEKIMSSLHDKNRHLDAVDEKILAPLNKLCVPFFQSVSRVDVDLVDYELPIYINNGNVVTNVCTGFAVLSKSNEVDRLFMETPNVGNMICVPKLSPVEAMVNESKLFLVNGVERYIKSIGAGVPNVASSVGDMSTAHLYQLARLDYNELIFVMAPDFFENADDTLLGLLRMQDVAGHKKISFCKSEDGCAPQGEFKKFESTAVIYKLLTKCKLKDKASELAISQLSSLLNKGHIQNASDLFPAISKGLAINESLLMKKAFGAGVADVSKMLAISMLNKKELRKYSVNSELPVKSSDLLSKALIAKLKMNAGDDEFASTKDIIKYYLGESGGTKLFEFTELVSDRFYVTKLEFDGNQYNMNSFKDVLSVAIRDLDEENEILDAVELAIQENSGIALKGGL